MISLSYPESSTGEEPLINIDLSIYKDLVQFKTLSMTSEPYLQMLQLRLI